MLAILTLTRWTQEDHKFKVCLGTVSCSWSHMTTCLNWEQIIKKAKSFYENNCLKFVLHWSVLCVYIKQWVSQCIYGDQSLGSFLPPYGSKGLAQVLRICCKSYTMSHLSGPLFLISLVHKPCNNIQAKI